MTDDIIKYIDSQGRLINKMQSMFVVGEMYILELKSLFSSKITEQHCRWDGTDFCPMKGVFIVEPYIQSQEPIAGRVEIVSLRKIQSINMYTGEKSY